MILLKRNLYYYRKLNIASILAVSVCIAIITGALLIGSTVKYNLQKTAENRLGFVDYAVITPAATLSSSIADSAKAAFNAKDNSAIQAIAVNFRPGSVINPADMSRINNIQLLGIDSALSEATGSDIYKDLPRNSAVINQAVADRLGVKTGDDIIVRFSAENIVSELALYSGDDFSKSWRLTISAIASSDDFGSFSLKAQQASVYNIFVSARQLAERLDSEDKRNMLLVGGIDDVPNEKAVDVLGSSFSINDLGYTVKLSPGLSSIQSSNIFIPDNIVDSLLNNIDSLKSFTGYLVNNLTAQNNKSGSYLFCGTEAELQKDQAILSKWMADRIGVYAGDKVTISYFVPADNNQLIEKTYDIQISAIKEIQYFSYMKELMPNIPGMTDSESCSDWEAGVPIDMDKITDDDEQYWDMYGMTPKLAISYDLAKELFGGRYGIATAVYKEAEFTKTESEVIEKEIAELAKPVIIPAAENAKFAVNNSMDFGGLFLSLSMFLIASSLILPAILFSLNIQDRQKEFASLSALGYRPAQIKSLIYSEIILLAGTGSLLGLLPGIAYAYWLQNILSSGFSGAIAGFNMELHIDLQALIYGYISGFILILAVCYFKIRKILKRSINESLKKTSDQQIVRKRKKIYLAIGIIMLATSLTLPAVANWSLMAFFGGGSIMLISGIALSSYLFSKKTNTKDFTLNSFTWNNLSRNSSSTIAVTISIACGVFMVIAVGLNHHNPLADSDRRTGPTGGFDKVANCSIPVNKQIKSDSDYLAFRVHKGDDASCLNLNRPVSPTIIAVDANKLCQLNPFSFAGVINGQKKNYAILNDKPAENIVPAIADYNTIMWALHKKIGDIIEIEDQSGNKVKLQLYAGLQSSILQGKIIVSESNFKRLYPNENGYSLIVFDQDTELEKMLMEYDAEVRPAVDVIGDFFKVENTYMSLFALLGGLGLIMGNIILGLTVIRNCQSQTREYAIMRSLGFTSKVLKYFIIKTYLIPVCIGIAIAVISALYSVWPKIITNYANLPIHMILYLLAGIFLTAIACIAIAGNNAVKGNIIRVLRNQ